MNQRDSISPRATFPEKKKNKFQEKFALLLQGQELGSKNGLEFEFNHDFSNSELPSERTSQISGMDSHEDLAYEEQIRKLKRRIMESKERKRKIERKKREDLHNYEEDSRKIRKKRERQFESHEKEEKNESQFNEKFNPSDLRLSRIPKKILQNSKENHKKDKFHYDDRKTNQKNFSYKEQESDYYHNNSNRQGKIKDTPRHRTKKPTRSEYTDSKVSNISRKNTSHFPKNSQMHISNYKKNMNFKARLKIKKIKFGSRKSGVLKFDVKYKNNFIPARKNHEINGYEQYLKETFNVPFRAIYDRRKRKFFCEMVVIDVMNMHKRLSLIHI